MGLSSHQGESWNKSCSHSFKKWYEDLCFQHVFSATLRDIRMKYGRVLPFICRKTSEKPLLISCILCTLYYSLNFSHLYLDLLVLTNAADDVGVDTNNADTYLVFQFIQYMWLKTFQLYRPIERDWARGWAVKKTHMETPLFSTRCSLDGQNLRIILF